MPDITEMFEVADTAAEAPVPRASGTGTVTGRIFSFVQPVGRQDRRLAERILSAVHQACDLGDLAVAGKLLAILETVLAQPGANMLPSFRRSIEAMVAAYQRLWHLRHASGAQGVGVDPGQCG